MQRKLVLAPINKCLIINANLHIFLPIIKYWPFTYFCCCVCSITKITYFIFISHNMIGMNRGCKRWRVESGETEDLLHHQILSSSLSCSPASSLSCLLPPPLLPFFSFFNAPLAVPAPSFLLLMLILSK